MGFSLRIEGFGKIEQYTVELTTLIKDIKERFCDAYKLDRSSVVPFVNSRRLLESHTVEEAHVTEAIPMKLYDTELARLILMEQNAAPKRKMETGVTMMGTKPMMSLRPWTSDKPKGGLGLF